MWRVLGIVALVWIGFMIIGAVFKLLMWVLVIGAVVAVGSAVYAAISNRGGPKALR
ncbi:MAG TPA: hypothetical protein VGJ95_04130 [Pseudonocardiaceae bacterium]|jgi:uncharacterized BrkB/YihY/UPF0761 family membrane protein